MLGCDEILKTCGNFGEKKKFFDSFGQTMTKI